MPPVDDESPREAPTQQEGDTSSSSSVTGNPGTSGATSVRTPVPPPLRFAVVGDDVPSRVDMRRWHKASIDERSFLERRVRKLKHDEAAAMKKLAETEARSARIAQIRERNDRRRAEHQQWREAKVRTHHRERAVVALAKSRESSGLATARTRVNLEKKERVLSARREHAVCELLVLSQGEARLERLRAQKKAIKEQEQTWKQSRDQEVAERRRQERQKELETLMLDREQNVNSSAKLIVQEASVLHRLQNLKHRNATALSQLSTIVGTPRPDDERGRPLSAVHSQGETGSSELAPIGTPRNS